MLRFLKHFWLASPPRHAISCPRRWFKPDLEQFEARQLLSLAVGYDALNRIHLFGIGTNSAPYEQDFDALGNPITRWYQNPCGGSIQSQSLTVSYDKSGLMHLFGVSPNQAPYEQDYDALGHPFNCWHSTFSGVLLGPQPLAVGYDVNGLMHVFGIGVDNQLYEQDFGASGQPISPWNPRYGLIVSMAVGQDTFNQIHVFAVAISGVPYELDFDAYGNPNGPWHSTFSGIFLGPQPLAVGYDVNGLMHVFGIGVDNQLYEQDYGTFGQPISPWKPRYGQLSSVAVGYDGFSQMHVFGVAISGRPYELDFDAYGNPISPWYRIDTIDTPVVFKPQPLAVGYDTLGLMHVFGVGLDSASYEQNYDFLGHPYTDWYLTDLDPPSLRGGANSQNGPFGSDLPIFVSASSQEAALASLTDSMNQANLVPAQLALDTLAPTGRQATDLFFAAKHRPYDKPLSQVGEVDSSLSSS
jgi:hypothetical protein